MISTITLSLSVLINVSVFTYVKVEEISVVWSKSGYDSNIIMKAKKALWTIFAFNIQRIQQHFAFNTI